MKEGKAQMEWKFMEKLFYKNEVNIFYKK